MERQNSKFVWPLYMFPQQRGSGIKFTNFASARFYPDALGVNAINVA